MNKYDLEKTRDKFKCTFTEANSEVKENNELKKRHVGFVSDYTTDYPYMEEAHMADALNNLSNAI